MYGRPKGLSNASPQVSFKEALTARASLIAIIARWIRDVEVLVIVLGGIKRGELRDGYHDGVFELLGLRERFF